MRSFQTSYILPPIYDEQMHLAKSTPQHVPVRAYSKTPYPQAAIRLLFLSKQVTEVENTGKLRTPSAESTAFGGSFFIGEPSPREETILPTPH